MSSRRWLAHWPVLLVVVQIPLLTNAGLLTSAGVVASLAMTIALAILSYQYLEVPFHALGRAVPLCRRASSGAVPLAASPDRRSPERANAPCGWGPYSR